MRKVIIALIAIAILAVCGIAQITMFSDVFGKEGIVVNGMTVLTDALDDDTEPAPKAEPKEKVRNMDPGENCGNGLCNIGEYN